MGHFSPNEPTADLPSAANKPYVIYFDKETTGASKDVTLETGAVIQVPQFINEGDVVSVNTETGQYSERAEKA